MTGSPDALDYPVWTDDALVSQVGAAIPVGWTGLGLFPVSAYGGVQVYFTPAVQVAELGLSWFDADPSNVSLAERIWTVRQGNILSVFEPNNGPVLGVDWRAAGAAGTGDLWLFPGNRPGVDVVTGNRQDILEVLAVTVGAGNTSLQWCQPYRGPATVWFQTDAAAYVAELKCLDIAAAQVSRLFRLVNAGSSQLYDVNIPSRMCRFDYTNNDGVARSLTVTIIGT